MTTEALEQQRDDAAPIETAALPTDQAIGFAPASADTELDQLLADFDNATSKPESDPANLEQIRSAPDASQDDALNQQIADLLGPDPKVAELQGQLNDLGSQMRAAEELKAFGEFADGIQKQLPDWLPPDWARTKLESMAHDPVARLAWDTRHIPPADAARDLAHVQHTLAQLQVNSNADPAKVRELNTLAYQLNIAANSPAILRRARNQIVKEANGLKPPYDPDATALYDEITAWMHGASTPVVPEKPVQWGRLSGRDFRERVLKEFGYDPGTSW
jgi:predicted  nucleic acid-binding Zn-ribbon protein